ncbi:MAG: hypothetical protein QXN59_00030 [Candidatus Micrarchaeaceae archaeon]
MTVTTVPMPFGTELAIIAIGLAYTALSIFAQRKISDPRKIRAAQAKMKYHTAMLNEMVKNKRPQEEILAKQREIMPMMTESMKLQMKSTMIIIPIFFLLYYVLMPALFGSISKETATFIVSGLNYRSLFFAVVLLSGMISAIIIMLYDRKKTKQEQAAFDSEGVSLQRYDKD